MLRSNQGVAQAMNVIYRVDPGYWIAKLFINKIAMLFFRSIFHSSWLPISFIIIIYPVFS